ncbi:MAG: hypothetical protein Tsb002_10720 [Wenzhouxiangellaceae bacterium]
MISSIGRAASGDLMVSPTRIIFEGRNRTAQVGLINRGSTTATYRVGFTQYRMQPDGNLMVIDQANERERFADHLIRYTPRQVTLAPNGSQIVRLMLRKPAELEAGEYRSHLWFYAIPDAAASNDIERHDTPTDDGFSVSLQTIFSISIPVIVRHGELNAEFSIHDVQLNNNATPSLNLTLQRQGNRSVYGDLDVFHHLTDTEQPVLVGHIKDLVLYTSHDYRQLELALQQPADRRLDQGRLLIRYQATEDNLEGLLASYELALP